MDDVTKTLARERRADGGNVLRVCGLAQQHGFGLAAQDECDGAQQNADHCRAQRVPAAVVSDESHAHAEEGKHQSYERAEVLQQDHGEFRRLRALDESPPPQTLADFVGLHDRGAE